MTKTERENSVSSDKKGRDLEYEDGIEPRQSKDENFTPKMPDFYLCHARIVFTIPGSPIKQFPTPESETFNVTTDSVLLQSSLEVYFCPAISI